MKRAVFLDRDGTVNIDKDYIFKVEQFEFIPGAIAALKRLQDAGFLLVVVTNQSGVGRGYYKEEDYLALDAHMKEALAKEGVRLAGTYACFHHVEGNPPYNVPCDCRKPQPGMLLAAQKELKIDMKHSYLVGDKWADIQAGIKAGLPPSHCLLVQTGKAGSDAKGPVMGALLKDITHAADYILENA